jgi:hypothetical protein
MILACSIISLILLLWFRTDVWVEYCRLFGLNFLSFYKDFDAKQYQDVSLTYHIYLRRYHNCFFVRLITCPICLAVWLCLFYLLTKCILFCLLAPLVGVRFLTILITLFGLACELPLLILGSVFVFSVIDRLLG